VLNLQINLTYKTVNLGFPRNGAGAVIEQKLETRFKDGSYNHNVKAGHKNRGSECSIHVYIYYDAKLVSFG
jgi:hypothetical protein